MDTPTPELDRQREIIKSGRAAVVQAFLDWLTDEQDWLIAHYAREDERFADEIFPVPQTKQAIMELFFKIDPNKIEAERRALLEELRTRNEEN